MKYTKRRFGAELILDLELEEFSVDRISRRAYWLSIEDDIDKDLKKIVQDLSCINAGPEFELTKDEVLKIAIDCVCSEDNHVAH